MENEYMENAELKNENTKKEDTRSKDAENVGMENDRTDSENVEAKEAGNNDIENESIRNECEKDTSQQAESGIGDGNVQQMQGVKPMQNQDDPGKGFGIASMVLGITSVVFFCSCINIPMAILAIIFGIVQLARGGKKSMPITGLITGIVSLVCFAAFWILVFTTGYGEYNFSSKMPEEIYEDIFDDDTFEDRFGDDLKGGFMKGVVDGYDSAL